MPELFLRDCNLLGHFEFELAVGFRAHLCRDVDHFRLIHHRVHQLLLHFGLGQLDSGVFPGRSCSFTLRGAVALRTFGANRDTSGLECRFVRVTRLLGLINHRDVGLHASHSFLGLRESSIALEICTVGGGLDAEVATGLHSAFVVRLLKVVFDHGGHPLRHMIAGSWRSNRGQGEARRRTALGLGQVALLQDAGLGVCDGFAGRHCPALVPHLGQLHQLLALKLEESHAHMRHFTVLNRDLLLGTELYVLELGKLVEVVGCSTDAPYAGLKRPCVQASALEPGGPFWDGLFAQESRILLTHLD